MPGDGVLLLTIRGCVGSPLILYPSGAHRALRCGRFIPTWSGAISVRCSLRQQYFPSSRSAPVHLHVLSCDCAHFRLSVGFAVVSSIRAAIRCYMNSPAASKGHSRNTWALLFRRRVAMLNCWSRKSQVPDNSDYFIPIVQSTHQKRQIIRLP
jgi:hypothetical protein